MTYALLTLMLFTSHATSTPTPAPMPSTAVTYELDPVHTFVEFHVAHMMISTVKGTFHEVSGSLNLDEKNIGKSFVDVTINTNSIDTGVSKRDEDLRSDMFLSSEKFPKIMFKSTKVQKHGKGLKITGLLTIRDQTKTVHLISKDMPTKPIKDPRGNWRIAVSATTSIKRHDFNILFDQKLPTGGLLVGEEVQIDINAELTRKDAKDSKAAELTHENPKYSTNQEKSSQNVHKKTPKKPMQNEQQETIQANNGQTNESENLSEELEKQEQQEQENQQQTSED